jgi:hypothetical protein
MEYVTIHQDIGRVTFIAGSIHILQTIYTIALSNVLSKKF